MDDELLIRTDVAFAVADADWRHELGKHFGRPVDEDALVAPAMRGEDNLTLRKAYEERCRAMTAWRRARGTA